MSSIFLAELSFSNLNLTMLLMFYSIGRELLSIEALFE